MQARNQMAQGMTSSTMQELNVPKAIMVVFREGNPNKNAEVVSHPYTYRWPYRGVPIFVGDWVVVDVQGRLKAVEVVKVLDEVPSIASKFPICKVDRGMYECFIEEQQVKEELARKIIQECENVRRKLALKELSKKSKELKELLAQAEAIGLDFNSL